MVALCAAVFAIDAFYACQGRSEIDPLAPDEK